MAVKKFEEILGWQKAGKLTMLIFDYLKSCKNYSFRDQMFRAVISIMNNIAEGFERQSNKEFIRFLYIAKGSCGEVRSMLYVAIRLKYVNEKQFNEMYTLSIETSKLIAALIKSL